LKELIFLWGNFKEINFIFAKLEESSKTFGIGEAPMLPLLFALYIIIAVTATEKFYNYNNPKEDEHKNLLTVRR